MIFTLIKILVSDLMEATKGKSQPSRMESLQEPPEILGVEVQA